jgi:hypothetical protein
MPDKPEVVVDVETAAAKLPDGVIDLNALTPDVQSGCRVFYWVNLVKSQDPSSKSQCTPNSQLPTRELILAVWLGFWDLGVRWSLELGSWDLTRAAQSSCAVSLSTRERNLVQHHS